MDKNEITILREQLNEKDEQIMELKSIINQITQLCSEVESEEEDTKGVTQKVHEPGFWKRHVTLSYIALCAVIILSLIVLVSPFVMPSLWERMGPSMQLNYTFAAIAFVGLGLIAWTNTPRGRKWLKDL